MNLSRKEIEEVLAEIIPHFRTLFKSVYNENISKALRSAAYICFMEPLKYKSKSKIIREACEELDEFGFLKFKEEF